MPSLGAALRRRWPSITSRSLLTRHRILRPNSRILPHTRSTLWSRKVKRPFWTHRSRATHYSSIIHVRAVKKAQTVGVEPKGTRSPVPGSLAGLVREGSKPENGSDNRNVIKCVAATMQRYGMLASGRRIGVAVSGDAARKTVNVSPCRRPRFHSIGEFRRSEDGKSWLYRNRD
jgi:hypothetical protein